MFGSIRTFLEKRRIRRDVETFMNPDEIEKVLKQGGPTPSFTPGRIEFDAILGALSRTEFGRSEEVIRR